MWHANEGNVIVSTLPQKYIDQYMEMLNNIEFTEYFGKAEKVFMDNMLPYFKDEQTLEDSIERTQSALEIYVSE